MTTSLRSRLEGYGAAVREQVTAQTAMMTDFVLRINNATTEVARPPNAHLYPHLAYVQRYVQRPAA